MITPAQCRAGRGLVRWNQDDLAREAAVSVVTVRNFENEKSVPQRATLEVMQRALEKAGVEFIAENGGGPGVRLKKRAKSVEEISKQIDVLEETISSIPTPTAPSPEAAMSTMIKAVAEDKVAKLKARRKRIRHDRSN
ncbi:XRE family transcriptional regulator [Methylocapsa sp. D3K7]|uniref:XRE family transcriptional regulator n=1 Tax=Methylocapsa sp. D3K7 TaxID=3041435 RepID=UPI00244E9D80|nr:XRE family transcriptional regulator [Methylocapsa sp. D3K7]WGJ13774.1 XRE family transcriptional regulator [Methylocapsa sp. D3K7]